MNTERRRGIPGSDATGFSLQPYVPILTASKIVDSSPPQSLLDLLPYNNKIMNDIVVSNKNKKDRDNDQITKLILNVAESTSVPEAVNVAGSDELKSKDVLSQSSNEHYDV